MLPNIGVMELHTNAETIYSVALLAKCCNANVTIFTTKLQYERVLPFFVSTRNDYRWVLQQDGEALFSFLKRIESHCNDNIDLLFVNTFYDLPHYQLCYLSFRPKCKTIHMVGRIEYLFGEWLPIKYLPGKLFMFSVLNNISQSIRKRILPMFDGLWVENKDAYNYAISAGYKKNVTCLSVHHSNANIQSHEYSGKLKFITIGTLNSDERRDYDGLLDAFEKLFDAGRKDITLTLLGAPFDRKGFQLIDRCRRLVEKGLDILFYTEYVPEELMNEAISGADAIINPIRIGSYGTGTSGAILKAMQFAKPGIYPINSLHYEELMSSSLFYNKIEELPGIIDDLLSNPETLNELSRNALANSEQFSLKTVTAKFQELLLDKYLIDL